MKYLKRCPLVVMLALSILIYEVLTGVPKILAFSEEQINKKEYRVEHLPEYPTDVSSNQSGTVSDGEFTQNGVSGNEVSENGVSGNSVSENQVSGNDVSKGENSQDGGNSSEQEGQQEITDANGGDITSSTSEAEDVGSTAPLTGVLLDKETGEALNSEEDDSPY